MLVVVAWLFHSYFTESNRRSRWAREIKEVFVDRARVESTFLETLAAEALVGSVSSVTKEERVPVEIARKEVFVGWPRKRGSIISVLPDVVVVEFPYLLVAFLLLVVWFFY